MSVVAYVIILADVFNFIWGMQVVPERASVGYLNEKYITDVKLNVRRYTRRGNYYINLEGSNKQTWTNNVTLHFIFYEYLHNEYKRSFVELHGKYCDVINKSPYIGKAIRAAGLTCPTPPSLQVIPERAAVKYINEKYIYGNGTIYVRRYGRKSLYYVNIEGTNKMEFGNNVSLNLVFYEFLHNEYKRSFVEMKFKKICESINNDPYVGKAFKMIGFACPVPAATHRIMNITVPADDFPNVWPFERCKVEASLVQNKNGDIMATADIYLLFKQKHKTI